MKPAAYFQMVVDRLKQVNSISLIRGCAFFAAVLEEVGTSPKSNPFFKYLNYLFLDMMCKAIFYSPPNWSQTLLEVSEFMKIRGYLVEAAGDTELTQWSQDSPLENIKGLSPATRFFYRIANRQFLQQYPHGVSLLYREVVLLQVLPEEEQADFEKFMKLKLPEVNEHLREIFNMPLREFLGLAMMLFAVSKMNAKKILSGLPAGYQLLSDDQKFMLLLKSLLDHQLSFELHPANIGTEGGPSYIYDQNKWSTFFAEVSRPLDEICRMAREVDFYRLGDHAYRLTPLEEFPIVQCSYEPDSYDKYFIPNLIVYGRSIASNIYFRTVSGNYSGVKKGLIQRIRGWAMEHYVQRAIKWALKPTVCCPMDSIVHSDESRVKLKEFPKGVPDLIIREEGSDRLILFQIKTRRLTLEARANPSLIPNNYAGELAQLAATREAAIEMLKADPAFGPEYGFTEMELQKALVVLILGESVFGIDQVILESEDPIASSFRQQVGAEWLILGIEELEAVLEWCRGEKITLVSLFETYLQEQEHKSFGSLIAVSEESEILNAYRERVFALLEIGVTNPTTTTGHSATPPAPAN